MHLNDGSKKDVHKSVLERTGKGDDLNRCLILPILGLFAILGMLVFGAVRER